jgi:hypothetical protein
MSRQDFTVGPYRLQTHDVLLSFSFLGDQMHGGFIGLILVEQSTQYNAGFKYGLARPVFGPIPSIQCPLFFSLEEIQCFNGYLTDRWSKSISTGAPKIVTSRASDRPLWGRRQVLPKFWGRPPTPAAPIRRPQKIWNYIFAKFSLNLLDFIRIRHILHI